MNLAQTFFAIFYGIYFAVTVQLTGPLFPFDTAAMYRGERRARFRFFVSFILLNVAPLFYFYMVYQWLMLFEHFLITFPHLLGLMVLSLGGFGFYRIYWGVMLWRNQKGEYLFYGQSLPTDAVNKIHDHPSREAVKAVLPNLIPGLVWVLLPLGFGWLWTHWQCQ